MISHESPKFLSGHEGTVVTFKSSNPTGFDFPRQTWIITKRVSQEPLYQITHQDLNAGKGPSFTAARFLCHRANDPTKMAFMGIYQQIPGFGTLENKFDIEAEPPAPPRRHEELVTWNALTKMKCDAVPKLLCYHDGIQSDKDLVPGGYITRMIWDKVPGESPDPDEYRKSDLSSRQPILARFREAYEYVHAGSSPFP